LRGQRIAIATCIWFFFAGQMFIPLLGIQSDEALFASPILEPKWSEYALTIGHRHVALMLMTYLGTLKTLLYKPLLRWFGTGAWSVREPMVLAGVVSIWLFYRLLRRIAGERAAVVGACLLAADTMYLLSSVYDWGPVALQHLLTVGGMLLVVRSAQEKRPSLLAAGCFLFGLALWDKALASWILSSMAVGAVLTGWREARALLRPRSAGLAAGAFVLGALPLLVYNGLNHGETFRGNAHFDTSQAASKTEILMQTIRGSALEGVLIDQVRPVGVAHPEDFFQSASATVAETAGHPTRNLIPYALICALLLTPLSRGRELRVALFAWIAMILAWGQMVSTAHAGGSVHHAILLWPAPYIAMAVPMSAASRRIGRAGLPALAAVTALLAMSSVLVTNEYYYRIARMGGPPAWSDGIWTLTEYLQGSTAPFVFCLDWGLLDSLRLTGHGRIPVRDGTEHTARPQLNAEDREALRRMLAIPGALFVGHPKDSEIFAGDTAKFLQEAADEGLRPRRVITIGDSFGRPTFEVYAIER
jgi:4-amino-4-deoxy-L-arabinose transferase-like glycosyltransferase